MINLIQVAPSKEVIIATHTKTPKIGNSGTNGTRYGRGNKGWVRRRMITPIQTMTKANSVPILVMCPNLEIGKNPAKRLIKTIKIVFEIHGVFHFGCTVEKTAGSKPSRDIE